MNPPRSGLAFLSLLLASSPAFAQAQSITLNVVVTEKSGHPIAGLKQQEFTLLDNQQPQSIVSFAEVHSGTQSAEAPVKVILLVDEVNASPALIARERIQIATFLGQNAGKLPLPVSLVFFTTSGPSMGDVPSQDGNALIAKLNNDKNPLRVVQASADRINLSLSALSQISDYEATLPGWKLLLWVSPGWPAIGGRRVNLNAGSQRGIFKNIVTLSEQLRQAQITLHSIDPSGTFEGATLRTSLYKEYLKGVSQPKQADFGDLALQVLATHSGGLVLNTSNDLASQISTCVADATTYYTLTFNPARGDGPNEYHVLDIKVAGAMARTLWGYYANPQP
jgi:VWFA-related protein